MENQKMLLVENRSNFGFFISEIRERQILSEKILEFLVLIKIKAQEIND